MMEVANDSLVLFVHLHLYPLKKVKKTLIPHIYNTCTSYKDSIKALDLISTLFECL